MGRGILWIAAALTRPLVAVAVLAGIWFMFGPGAIISLLDLNMLILKGIAAIWPQSYGGGILQYALTFLGSIVEGMKWLGAQPEKWLPPALNFGPAATAFLVLVVEAIPLLLEILLFRVVLIMLSIPRHILRRRNERAYIRGLQKENARLRGNNVVSLQERRRA